jgi:hypothetical protein
MNQPSVQPPMNATTAIQPTMTVGLPIPAHVRKVWRNNVELRKTGIMSQMSKSEKCRNFLNLAIFSVITSINVFRLLT